MSKMELISPTELLSANIINWQYLSQVSGDLRLFMLGHSDNFKNLDNKSYWRGQMTEEEIKMRRHPNRSAAWIPNRIEKIRHELQVMLLEVAVGKNNFKEESFWNENDCLNCGCSFKAESEFRKEMASCLGSMGDDSMETVNNFVIRRQECWDNIITKYDITTSRTQDILDWNQRSRPFGGANRIYGFCNYCWVQTVKPKMKMIINNIIST